MRRNLEDVLAGRTTPDDFTPSVWDEWKREVARVKADDALVADEAVTEALEAVSPGDRARIAFPMGPLSLDFDHAVAMRLNEHAFHTWDIEVVFDDGARLPHDVAAVVVDNLELVAALRGQADRCGAHDRRRPPRTRHASSPWACPPTAWSSPLARSAPKPDIELPAEAFCRLVYGRLDPEHTPHVTGDESALDTLRAVFPGF